MKAPFSALIKSLQSVFHLEVMRNGKYIYPAVQQLREAMEHYNPKANNTFLFLQKAIKEAFPYIQKRRINLDTIKIAMDELTVIHHAPPIDWLSVKTPSKASSRFQFSALNHRMTDIDLVTWIENRTGKDFSALGPSELTQTLIDNKNELGFSQRLSAYLKEKPTFLFDLIKDSKKNFIKICHSRLILYLTDQQIAESIIEHITHFVYKKSDPFVQVEQLVHTLNDILSNGRSISTLLRNAEAKPILSNSIFFQLYQSESYSKYQDQALRSEEDLIGETMRYG